MIRWYFLLLSFSVYSADVVKAISTTEQALQKTPTYRQVEDKFWTLMPIGQSTAGKIAAVYYLVYYHNIDVGRIVPLHTKNVDVSLQYNYDNGSMNAAIRYHLEF